MDRHVRRCHEIVEDLTRGGRVGIDVIQMSIARIGHMMIDVDPERDVCHRSIHSFSKARLGRGVQREDDVRLDFLIARTLHKFRAW